MEILFESKKDLYDWSKYVKVFKAEGTGRGKTILKWETWELNVWRVLHLVFIVFSTCRMKYFGVFMSKYSLF